VYFHFPYQHAEEISIELPVGWQTSSVPKPRNEDLKAATYTTSVEQAPGLLRLKRELTVNLLLLDVKDYPLVRNFYQAVRAGDEDQVVIAPPATP
jgi:hypothetical protein